MTSTPRLDSITADGTGDGIARVRLADGHALNLKIQSGADTAEEVALFPGLTAPATEAWEREDSWEEWLTGGNLGEGRLFLEVPVQAVRELIEQHGGEHEDQEGGWPEPGTGESAAPDLLTELADLTGRFKDGYSADDINSVFGRIYDEGGPDLVCVWEHLNADGFGGTSQFYAENDEGLFFELQPDVRLWLSGERETPGPVDAWVGAPVAEFEFLVSDDFHNYARSED